MTVTGKIQKFKMREQSVGLLGLSHIHTHWKRAASLYWLMLKLDAILCSQNTIIVFILCTVVVQNRQNMLTCSKLSKPLNYNVAIKVAVIWYPFLVQYQTVWTDRSISLSSKIWLMRFLVTSIFLYACGSWTLTAELQRRIQAKEMRCYRKILHISYKDHVTNEEAHAKIQQAIGPHEDLLTHCKETQTAMYGHVFHSSGLAKTILQGTVRGGRGRGR